MCHIIMAAAAPHIDDLPPNVLRHVLLAAVRTDNLLRFVAACARVCGDQDLLLARETTQLRKLCSAAGAGFLLGGLLLSRRWCA